MEEANRVRTKWAEISPQEIAGVQRGEVVLFEVKRSATGNRGLPTKEGMVYGRRHKRKLARRDAA